MWLSIVLARGQHVQHEATRAAISNAHTRGVKASPDPELSSAGSLYETGCHNNPSKEAAEWLPSFSLAEPPGTRT